MRKLVRALFSNLWLCLTIALSVRLAFVLFALPVLEGHLALSYDADGYGKIADTILVGEYRDIERAPAYPAFVAAIYAGFDHSNTAIKVFQAILDTVTVLLIYVLGRRVAPNSSVSAWAMWLYALYPLAWWRCGFINKEILQTVTLAIFVLTFLIALEAQSSPCSQRHSFLISGFALGVANLVKPIFLLLPLVLAFWFWRERSKLLRPLDAFLALLMGMSIAVLPWTFRNYKQSGEFVPIALERGGLTFYVGNYYPNRGAWEGPQKAKWQAELARIAAEHPDANAVQMDRIYFRETLSNIAAHPFQFAEMFVRKAWRFWFSNASGRMGRLVLAVQFVFAGLGIIGICRRRTPSSPTLFFLILIGYLWLLHAAIYSDVRFSLPVMPYVMLLGASALTKYKDEEKPI